MTAPQNRKMRFCPDAIPAELRARLRWVVTGPDKVPYTPLTGRKADPTAPATGDPFADAVAAAERSDRFDRVGIILDPTTRIVAIDFDHCRDPETGAIDPETQDEIDLLATYTEKSPSGTGVRCIARGELPPGRRKNGRREAYDRDRYVSITGYVLQGRDRIEERTAELAAWHALALGDPTPSSAPIAAVPLEIDDRALLARCLGNAKFRALHERGDAGDYGGDESAADLAYVNVIVRNGGTPDQADCLYRESAIARPKWDERRGQGTYGERTVARAFDGTVVPFAPAHPTAVVSPERGRLAATGTEDATADALPDDVTALKAMIVDLTRRVEAAERRADAAEARTAMLSSVQSTTGRIIRNNKLGQERMTAVALSYAFANREAAGDAGEDGLYPLPLARIAETAGISEDAAARHVKKLAEAGVLRKELRSVPVERVDRESGEIVREWQKRQYVGPTGGKVVDFVEAVAALAPEKPKGWGGTRTSCPDHPHAGTVKRWSVHCAECDRLIDAGTETRPADPKPQDAALADDPFAVATGDPTPRNAPPYPAVDGHYRDRKLRIDHNATRAEIPIIPDAGTTVAAAFQRGQRLPGMAEEPPDRWTG